MEIDSGCFTISPSKLNNASNGTLLAIASIRSWRHISSKEPMAVNIATVEPLSPDVVAPTRGLGTGTIWCRYLQFD